MPEHGLCDEPQARVDLDVLRPAVAAAAEPSAVSAAAVAASGSSPAVSAATIPTTVTPASHSPAPVSSPV